jgi:hypothetical protein
MVLAIDEPRKAEGPAGFLVHGILDHLAGGLYGEVAQFMNRASAPKA